MKTIQLSYTLNTNGKKLAVSLQALFRAVGLDGEVKSAEIPGEVLDTLRVRLVSPGVTGALELSQDAKQPCYYTLDGSDLTVSLSRLVGGMHRLTLLVKYGTNTRALLVVDLSVPENIQFLQAGSVIMPLIRDAEKDAELEGVQYYGYTYPYGEQVCWLQTDKPLHIRGTVQAYYADNLETALADATALEGAHVVLNANQVIFDAANQDAIALGAVDTFGSVGGGDVEEETVTVRLSAPDTVNWPDYHITVENLTTGSVSSVNIDENGVGTFTVNAGESFTVELPILQGYVEPLKRTYVAVSAEKEITYEYGTTPHTERVVVYAHSTVSALAGLIGAHVILTTTEGVEETREFGADLRVEFEVEYGSHVTVVYPAVDGITPHVHQVQFVANRPERDLVAYYDNSHIGAFGRDIAGNWYKLNNSSELEDMDGNVIPDPSVVEFVALNTSALDMSKRDVTGVETGNGFMVQCDKPLLSGRAWAAQNVEFDTSKLPFGTDYRGAKNTEYIRQIGDAMNVDTPAADGAYNQTITFEGGTRHGFLLAILQLQAYKDNYTQLNAIATAAGRTIPSVASGSVWSSSQCNATNAYYLLNGNVDNNGKNYTYAVLVGYDL